MADEEKRVAPYYSKPAVELGQVKPGTYVYDAEGRLCYVDDDWRLHSYGIETSCSRDSIVYPVTLETKRIMDKMAAHREKYYKGNIMCPQFSGELREALHDLMSIDVNDRRYGGKERGIWMMLEHKYAERVEYAKALHIFRG